MRKTILNCLIALLAVSVYGQKQVIRTAKTKQGAYQLDWQKPGIQKISETEEIRYLLFAGVGYDPEKNQLPFFTVAKKKSGEQTFDAELTDIIETSVVDADELNLLKQMEDFIGQEYQVEFFTREIRKQKDGYLKIVPIRKTANGSYEKLVSFDINWKPSSVQKKATVISANSFANSSVLASGNWYRLGTTQAGVYKIDRNFISSLGLDPDSINPQNIRIYGNGGQMLPESNLVYRNDDLVENAILVTGEADGSFDNGDYALFYAQSPHQWIEQSAGACIKFKHKVNVYSDTTYYFFTTDLGPGKRIQNDSSVLTPNKTVNSFDDFLFYELNASNLIKSGREWYGEYFDILTSYSFNFNFPNIVPNDTVYLEAALANRMGSADANAYSVYYPGGSVSLTSGVVSLTNYTAPYAADGSVCTNFKCSSSSFSISVNKNNSGALGWLNYIRLNARRQLTMSGSQMLFRDKRSVGAGNVSQFVLSGASANISIWETTNIFNVKNEVTNFSGTTLDFTKPTDSLRSFVAFTNSGFLSPVNFGRIPNQNLHSIAQADFIIVSHPDFLAEAARIAQLHADLDTLSYVIVTPQQIYNEFSSGSQDIVAVRDFVRMIYKRSAITDLPRYLLLFGDGSYRYKANASLNTNYVAAYQSPNSLQPTGSYTSDDFFGLLDDTEGDFTGDAVDIGVGRIPAKTVSEANQMVTKIVDYTKTSGNYNTDISSCANSQCNSMGDWRNWICFVGDDEDNDLHVSQADSLSRMVAREHPVYNVNKIYFDAYTQESTPGGHTYPDVNREFDKQVERGCLILNYTGHGGELGLAHEGVVGISQINGYENYCSLPLWFTATCEFSRYDDPDRTSAGEYVILNPRGAGIALMTTVRLVYANSNFNLSLKIWARMLDSLNGQIPAMGELFMLTKQEPIVYNDANCRNFTLLGDPALKLAYPRNLVVTDSVNGVSISATTDTLKALSKITVKGHISNSAGNKLTSYNGVIFPIVFDKASSITTLANDPASQPFTFKLQKNIIYRGKSSVVNGDFTYSFIVPKDIAYNYGFGKLSYYTHNGFIDGAGYYDSVVVGGSDPNAIPDNVGPTVKLFMNDNKFVSGGTTNENPKIYAELIDSSGINTVGNGIGHDIIAIVDENSNAPVVLNDYYQADLNSYQAGKVLYGLTGISEGDHTLSLKVWDVQNNSNTAFLDFVVARSAELALKHVLNYPNPFSTKTEFFLEHNDCCSQLTVAIDVFTISGKVVKCINKTITNQGFRSDGIEWDGRDEFGDKLAKGVYIYKVKIKDNEGKTSEKFEKLVILN
ncbi:MAG: type IX secretion system sortase PorU [Bacteroidia bacterium]|nr:type IX secretion system sortase PorU [Bacteroidia bacterium]